MNLQSVRLFILLCGFAYALPGFTQGTGNEEQLQKVVETSIANYQKAIGPQSQLYRGSIYEFYDVRSISGPLFNDTLQFKNGNVKYYGTSYKNIPLLYDLNLKQLVSMLYDNTSKFVLLSEGVSEFDIYGHHFIRLVPDTLNKKMDVGFYDELYNNKLQLLVKRTKTGQFESLTGKRVYYLQTTYYLKKGSIYQTVRTKGQVLDVLSDKKKELKKYLKDNHIDYSDDKERAMVMLLTYYDRITN